MTADQSITAQCPCGDCTVQLAQMPSLRFLCHCTICQSVYPGHYADATVIRADKVTVEQSASLKFSQLKKPPALDRGVCASCQHPVVGFLESPGLPRLAFLPTAVLPQTEALPKPIRHVFYGTRKRDVDDPLPKTQSDWASKLVLLPPMIRVLRGG